ncbi:MAG: hypothetical protein LBE56_00565 [Tannerella sp.]|jgi:hypothetical protein|nr:hypothetical protein [Tannerella sp.]
MGKRLVFIMVLSGCMLSASYPQAFSTRKLSDIYQLFPNIGLPLKDSIFGCAQVTTAKSLVIGYNKNNEINHLGVSLFSPESKQMIGIPVCNFIEQTMLVLQLQKSSQDVRYKLNEYGMRLRKNGFDFGSRSFDSINNMLTDLQNPADFSLQKDSIYSVLWQFGDNQSFSMSFPISREQIFGTDKMESDEKISESLVQDNCSKILHPESPESIAENELSLIQGTDIYRRKGLTLINNSDVNTDTYYQRSDRQYSLVFDTDHPNESLVNLFLNNQIDNSLMLKISHRKYGGFSPALTIPLNRFICLFEDEFTTFCLLRKSNNDLINMSVILFNKNFDFVHLLRVSADRQQLFSADGTLTADFYTNIPFHNIKNLFE